MMYLFEGLFYALMLVLYVTWPFIAIAIVIWLIGILRSHANQNHPSEYTTSSQPTECKRSKSTYTHRNRYGIATGFSSTDESGNAEHYSLSGKSHLSLNVGNDTVHLSTNGLEGYSTTRDGGKTYEHYTSGNMYDGYSKVEGDHIDHYDKWGLYTGSSEKD